MKLPGLISLISILASSKGQGWNITVPQRIIAKLGSNVTIPCNFSYPDTCHTDNVEVYWKTFDKAIDINDNDKNPFVYHPIENLTLEKYKGRTRLVGNKNMRDCSLEILNVTETISNIYMRLVVKDKYSFKRNTVSISLSETGDSSVNSGKGVTSSPYVDAPTDTTPQMTDMAQKISMMHVTIFISVSALLVIIIISGIFCYIKHKRSSSFTREESGYYANFSGASLNQAQREASSKNHENKKLSGLTAIDEPVYVNTEALTGQMDQSMDHMDNVYANVDYSK
ncbi:uncharacterized protein [Trachinotus anak]